MIYSTHVKPNIQKQCRYLLTCSSLFLVIHVWCYIPVTVLTCILFIPLFIHTQVAYAVWLYSSWYFSCFSSDPSCIVKRLLPIPPIPEIQIINTGQWWCIVANTTLDQSIVPTGRPQCFMCALRLWTTKSSLVT